MHFHTPGLPDYDITQDNLEYMRIHALPPKANPGGQGAPGM
jgi:hypothetical protein